MTQLAPVWKKWLTVRAIPFGKRWLPWLLVVAAAFFTVWFGYEQIPKSDVRDTFLGGLLATVIGLVAGIPIALEINRYQSLIQEKQERKSEDREKLDRKIRILSLIKQELGFNQEFLVALVEVQADHPDVVINWGLKNDLWKALADGGELPWIDDLQLLDAIARAYYYIRRIMFFEDFYFSPNFRAAVSNEGRQTYAGERIVKAVTQMRPDALGVVNEALAQIEQHLNSAHRR